MPASSNHFWNKNPFFRLLFPLAAGILIQWYIPALLTPFLFFGLLCLIMVVLYQVLPLSSKFRFFLMPGIAITGLLLSTGAALVWKADIRNKKEWMGFHYTSESYVIATLQEPLIEKTNSYKALAAVNAIYRNDRLRPVQGQLILYFKKDSSIQHLDYGTQVLIRKPLQEIKNAGNPGSFDYKRYSLFQGITHQAFLSGNDFSSLAQNKKQAYKEILFRIRSWVLTVLRRYIQAPREQGLAEALLIGYKDDLDKNLVQSYSNTGVVHVIAISGLHLGIIYWLLLGLTKPLKRKRWHWIRLIIILAGLWIFSLLAGAQPSVLRSAVMFTAIAFSVVLSRKSRIYNTLALSAFLLLCINPFWLWDVGFQLSYAAVFSIFLFFRPIYNWLYFPNKAVDFVWKLMAVSIAAQVLTLPVSLYHFHQFPVLFLITNLLAVPLSSAILIGEILLCALFFMAPVAKLLGALLEWLIRLMNNYIEQLDAISFAVWNGISVSAVQTILLYGFIAGTSLWLLEKKQVALWPSLICLFLFTSLRSLSFIKAQQQKKIIIYNVPRYQAIDVVDGRVCCFMGDTTLQQDAFLRNFHIQPSRILHRIKEAQTLSLYKPAFTFCGRRILIIDTTLQVHSSVPGPPVDVVVLSKNPRLYIHQLQKAMPLKQIVIDGSVPQWKASLWKRDCDSLQIPCYDVTEKGAFVMDLK